MLKLNEEGLMNEFLKNLELELEVATNAWRLEAEGKFRGIKFTYESQNKKAEVDKEIIRQTNKIIVFLKANKIALADSYGVGSLMTLDNPGLQDYMRNKQEWNPARTGTKIVGRPAGTYTDIFGNKHKTSGKLAGKPLENKSNITGTRYFISPSSPSYALQMAEKWLYKTYLPRAYKNAIQATNFSKFLIES